MGSRQKLFERGNRMADVNEIKVSPKELAVILEAYIRAGEPIMLSGAPGVGKSDIVAQAARAAGAELIVTHPVVSDPTDYKGMPWVSTVDGKVKAEFIIFQDLEKICNATVPTIVFLDDLGQASPSVQAACMQLLLNRAINGKKVSDFVTFIAATNRKQDKAAVTGILEPVKSRFGTILEVTPVVQDWIEWALDNDVSIETIAFIQYRPEFLFDFRPTTDMTNSPSPRTVVNADKAFKKKLQKSLTYKTVAGAAGVGYATEFMSFIEVCYDLPNLTDIIMNPTTAPVSTRLDVQCAVAAALAQMADEGNLEQVLTYIDRLGRDIAWFCVKTITIRDKERKLVQTKAFSKWAIRNQDLL
jgi:predicted ATPase